MQSATDTASNTIVIPEAPAILGLSFRNFRGKDDYPKMLALINACKTADNDERFETLEDMARNYSHLTNCDPYRDLITGEVDGETVVYSRVTWWIDEATGDYIYQSFGYLDPKWRRKGIGQSVLLHNQRRLREIAAEHPKGAPKFFESFATNFQEGSLAMLEKDGYQPVRHFFSMVRPDLESIPDLPLPDGIEVRPANPEHYRQIWEAFQEAFRDHWGYSEPQEEDYQNWIESSEFQPDLWQIAWDGDFANGAGAVAGMILNFINHGENQEYGRKRGYTEGIAVRRPWRRRGLARTLLARSLKMHRELGMSEAALGVDSGSLSGANLLYESMGFKPVKTITLLHKAMV
ncbi:MAG: GNAT family N-acetyltransferase [Anaerolineaceae bacterium]|nr:GNAT family N-acetyltransferase [Anaerolineaceae bacterium]